MVLWVGHPRVDVKAFMARLKLCPFEKMTELWWVERAQAPAALQRLQQ